MIYRYVPKVLHQRVDTKPKFTPAFELIFRYVPKVLHQYVDKELKFTPGFELIFRYVTRFTPIYRYEARFAPIYIKYNAKKFPNNIDLLRCIRQASQIKQRLT